MPEAGPDSFVYLARMASSTLDLLAGYLAAWMEDLRVGEMIATALG